MIPATAAVLGERSRQVWLGFNLQSTWIRPSVKAAEGKFCYFVGLLSFDAEHDFPHWLNGGLIVKEENKSLIKRFLAWFTKQTLLWSGLIIGIPFLLAAAWIGILIWVWHTPRSTKSSAPRTTPS